jgi:hypothetical protein
MNKLALLACLSFVLGGCSLPPKTEPSQPAITSNSGLQAAATKPVVTNSDFLQLLLPSLDFKLLPSANSIGLQQPTIPDPSHNPANGTGLLLADAHTKSRELLPGMSQAKVKDLLGEPDDVSATTAGSQTPHPWNALIWRYVWKTYPYGGTLPSVTQFTAVFENSNDGWVVNSFFWFP